MDVGIKPGWLIALGAIWGVTVGALIVFISRSKPLAGVDRMPPINIWNVAGGMQGALPAPAYTAPAYTAPEQPQPVMLAAPAETRPTKMATYTLQTDRAIRIMTAASQRFWRVQLRTIGPAGGVASISTEINATAYPSQSVQVPTGYPYEVRVKPGDALFALGNVANVELSVTASEELT